MRKMSQRYGQHFLVNENIIEQIVQAAQRLKSGQLVEIGPGKGALTFALIKAGFKNFKAAELDPEMISFLREHLPPQAGVEILPGDFSLQPDALLGVQDTLFVGNLPYVAAADILDKALSFAHFSAAVFMFQKEQANRIQAQAGGEFYGPLSILSQSRAKIALLCNVGKGCFNPPPKVQSAVLTFEKLPQPFIAPGQWAPFKKLVTAAFLHRRKTIYNSLLLAGYAKDRVAQTLEQTGLSFQTRAEQITAVQFKQMTQLLTNQPL